jgi:hypothetical protein
MNYFSIITCIKKLVFSIKKEEACSNRSVQRCIILREVWVVESLPRTIMLFFRHFLVSHLRFIGHRVDAFFRRFHIDFDKR